MDFFQTNKIGILAFVFWSSKKKKGKTSSESPELPQEQSQLSEKSVETLDTDEPRDMQH